MALHNDANIVFNVSQTERSENFQDIYANIIRLGIGPTDLTITFGAVDDKGMNNLVGKDLVAVRLSPQTFKMLTLQLAQALQLFEARSGIINIPDELVDVNTNNGEETKKAFAKPLPRKPRVKI